MIGMQIESQVKIFSDKESFENGRAGAAMQTVLRKNFGIKLFFRNAYLKRKFCGSKNFLNKKCRENENVFAA